MKKFLLFVLSLTVAVSASAAFDNLTPRPDLPVVVDNNKPNRHNFRDYIKANMADPVATLRDAPEGLIFDQPEGELVTYQRSGIGLDLWNMQGYEPWGIMSIVYAPDGETVYIQNPISMFWPDVWMTGTLQGNKIHVPMGQYICWEEDEAGQVFSAKMVWAKLAETEDSVAFIPDETVTEATFTIDGDVITMDNSAIPTQDNPYVTGWAAVAEDGTPYNMECVMTYTAFFLPTVITVQPEGELKSYRRSGYYMDSYYKTVRYQEDLYNSIMNIVYAPDGETVYIQNPAAGGEQGSWVKGSLQGNTITVPMGQYTSWDDKDEYGTVLTWATYEDGVFQDVPEVTEVTYTIDGNIITLNGTYGDDQGQNVAGLGEMWNDDHYVLCVEWNTVLTNMPAFIYDLPDGLEPTRYLRTGYYLYNEKGGMDMQYMRGETDIAIDYETRTVYMKDVIEKKYSLYGWLRGTLSDDGTKITVPVGQCIYYNESDGETRNLVWGSTSVVPSLEYDDQYMLQFTIDPNVEAFTFTLHDNGFISLDNSTEPDYIQYIKYRNQYWNDEIDWETFQQLTLGLWNQTGICSQDLYDGETYYDGITCSDKYALPVPVVPANPVILEWYDCGSETGDSFLAVENWNKDVNGFGLSDGNISYTVYTDNDQPYTFLDSDYSLRGENLTEVPHYWWNGRYKLYPDNIHFYRTNAEGYEPFFSSRIGIQFHYTVDGVKNSSDIVYINVFDNPVEPTMPGDVNGDDTVSVADVTALIDALLGNGMDGINQLNADVNGDHEISVADVTALIDQLLGN